MLAEPAPEREVVLEARDLSKSYDGREVLSGVSLEVRAGEVLGLLGRNGAGKTTLLQLLLGLARPDQGAVEVLGRHVAGTAQSPVPGGVGGFIDAPRFYPHLSGRQNLLLLARWDDDTTGRPDSERVDAALRQVDLCQDADAKVKAYSSGMRQKLGLAGALMRSPRLLLLDEPMSSLDPKSARGLRAELGRLAAEGVAIVLATHDVNDVFGLCSAVSVLEGGRLSFVGPVASVRAFVSSDACRLRTSDDARALSLATDVTSGCVVRASDDDGLVITGGQPERDAYVLELARAGVAVRAMQGESIPLDALLAAVTAHARPPSPPASPRPAPPVDVSRRLRPTARGVLRVVSVEVVKVAGRPRGWALLAALALGPFAFAAALKLQADVPEDSLFGSGVTRSGFALPLVVLGFAASWLFPFLAGGVAGDVFSAEDRHGTWPTLLTRSRHAGEIFAGKVVMAFALAGIAHAVLGASSVAAGVSFFGPVRLLGLSGTLLTPKAAGTLTALAWAYAFAPVLALCSLAVLGSVASRSGVAGLALPLLVSAAMNLLSFVTLPEWLHQALLTTSLSAWHGLFAEPRFYAPLLIGAAVSGACGAGCLVGAYALYMRREVRA